MTGTTLITGGASGIGRLHAIRIAESGARVAVLDRNENALSELAGSQAGLVPFACDVTDHGQLVDIVARVEGEIGPIERLIVCAAIMPSGALLDTPADKINQIMQVNYGGTVNITSIVLPLMLARGRGDVVIYGSTAGIIPIDRFGAYGATKAALNHYARVLMSENRGKGLRFQLVCPPAVDTPLIAQALEGGPGLLQPGRNWLSQMVSPEEVVDSVDRAFRQGREINYPGRGKLIELAYRAFPRLIQSVSNRG
ncbi:MAG: SDR family NAD(P)-dependent oxidoreductase [Rhizobiaceae bacterium]